MLVRSCVRLARSRSADSAVQSNLMVGGTAVQAEHLRYFEDPTSVWTARDRKLEKRVEGLQRKQLAREKFAFARTARRDDGGADTSLPFDNQLLFSPRRQNARVDGEATWADSVRQLRVGKSVQSALCDIIETDYKADRPHAELFRAQLCIEAVRMTRDTRVARIYYSTTDDSPAMRQRVLKCLVDAAPQIRSLLVRRVPLKYAPELKFMKEVYNLEQRRAEMAMAKILADIDGADQDR